ncbi:MAG: Asp-tRNA(Asn)/Glu-tRNA(Gln) amidotransferase subunit GatB [Candidatus Portnoybacteria bacterium]|nr:Asp-tRNA(Asn)/Glu-tRNA(Gln) amidotransferase subunit GatB [Candidatus Portnoybacteria bacterium]
MKYEAVIGMEIHAELKTKTKMFCGCENVFGLEKEANIHICPVCTGQPGTLPVANREAIKMVLRTAQALNCQIAEFSKFDRKNYFYPDLPKGYQISQYDKPLSEKGFLEINGKKIGITRIHLEEDTGKLSHPAGADYSLVDYNRAGVPMMELVTEPDITSAAEAKKFCQELQMILRYIRVSDADMEKGQMRCEVNISLRPEGSKEFGTKVEVKNINSFKAVEKSIEYEIKRQEKALLNGEKIIQETRGWNESKQVTVSQRTKEEAHDYRYFPEPDLPPIEPKIFLDELGPLPELPQARKARFMAEHFLPEADAEIMIARKELGDYFENMASELKAWAKSSEPEIRIEKALKLAANYMITELQKLLAQNNADFKDLKITAENFAEFIKLTAQGVVSSSAAQAVLAEMFKTGVDPSHVIEEKNLAQLSDESELDGAIAEVISKNPGPVGEYKKGKEKAIQFLLGKVMAATKGRANPQVAEGILKKKLAASDQPET